MRFICSLATAAIVVAGPFVAPVMAADRLPGFKIEERPFGGPPPKTRGLKRYGKKCRTQQRTCGLEKEEAIDSDCACPGRGSPRGKVIE